MYHPNQKDRNFCLRVCVYYNTTRDRNERTIAVALRDVCVCTEIVCSTLSHCIANCVADTETPGLAFFTKVPTPFCHLRRIVFSLAALLLLTMGGISTPLVGLGLRTQLCLLST